MLLTSLFDREQAVSSPAHLKNNKLSDFIVINNFFYYTITAKHAILIQGYIKLR